jgi:lysophospholipase L1-like esterase
LSLKNKEPRKAKWFDFVIILVGTVFILEIAFRIFFGHLYPTRFFEPHDTFGHFHVPGRQGWQYSPEYTTYTAINSNGLRDVEYSYEKKDGVYRILIIGDSFAEGLQVNMDQTFAKVLEKELNDAETPTVEVINAGVSRYGTDNSLLFLEKEGLRYQPDLVIYAFYPNDVTDNIEKGFFSVVDGNLEYQPVRISLIDRIRGPIYDISYIYRVGLSVSLVLNQRADPTLISTDWGLVLPIYREELQPREENAWQLTGALLIEMRDVVNSSGAKLMVVYLPESFQISDRQWSQVEHSQENLERYAPQQRLSQEIPNGIMYLDLTPGFQTNKLTEELYYQNDLHFNPQGHALAGQLI